MSGSQSALYGGGAALLWVSGATYPVGRVTISPSDFNNYVRKVAGAGATDPSADATNWQPYGGRAIKSVQRGTMTHASTATISAVNVAKTELRFLGSTGKDATGGNAIVSMIALTNSTTITSTSTSVASPSGNVSWELTERY